MVVYSKTNLNLEWRKIQKNNITSSEQLFKFLRLNSDGIEHIFLNPKFNLNIPLRLAQKIKKNDLNDPIFLQFVPLVKEQLVHPQFSTHPVLDTEFTRAPKLIQKYHGRALLLTSSACAMHCRFCFRQNFPYETSISNYDKELQAIQKDPSIQELILSGGDPLSLPDNKLRKLIQDLECIAHIKLLRFHTRFPIGIPERITKEFLEIIESSRLQTIFVIHTNHPKELDDDVLSALKKIHLSGATLLSHSVLLKNVNDNLETLETLFLKLAKSGIIPYYLNQLDKVQGSAHFEVDLKKGLQLTQALREKLPGYAVPRFIQEIPFEKHKTLL